MQAKDALTELLSSPQGTIVGKTFNGLLAAFLSELQETFPERVELKLAVQALSLAADENPMKPIKAWLSSMSKLTEAGHPSPFFTECTEQRIQAFFQTRHKMHPLLALLPIEEMWNDPLLVDDDRQAIWDHLKQLEMASMAIDAFEPTALAAIEDMARRYMTSLHNVNPADIDIRTLGLDVIQQVMNDQKIQQAISTPEAEKRFNNVMGDYLSKSASEDGSGLSGLLKAVTDSGINVGEMGLDTAGLQDMVEKVGKTFSQADIAAMLNK